jgi:hypothetical protein
MGAGGFLRRPRACPFSVAGSPNARYRTLALRKTSSANPEKRSLASEQSSFVTFTNVPPGQNLIFYSSEAPT